MVVLCAEHDLADKISVLRHEVGAQSSTVINSHQQSSKEGYRILPQIRVRDNSALLPNQVRVRNYTEYLLDKEFEDPTDAVASVIESLRKIAQMNITKMT